MFCLSGRFVSLQTFCPSIRSAPPYVLPLRTFCPSGCSVLPDVLSPRTFCPFGRSVPPDIQSLRTFFPMDILSPDVLIPDIFVSPAVMFPDFWSGSKNCHLWHVGGVIIGIQRQFKLKEILQNSALSLTPHYILKKKRGKSVTKDISA